MRVYYYKCIQVNYNSIYIQVTLWSKKESLKASNRSLPCSRRIIKPRKTKQLLNPQPGSHKLNSPTICSSKVINLLRQTLNRSLHQSKLQNLQPSQSQLPLHQTQLKNLQSRIIQLPLHQSNLQNLHPCQSKLLQSKFSQEPPQIESQKVSPPSQIVLIS